MSLICQTFVQNSWKNDLCSNCFRSKGDHESCGKQSYSDANYGNGSLSRRYIGVAGRSMYARASYYGMNTWTSILDRDSDYLKSPGLIKGMDNLIKENEKNQIRKETSVEENPETYNNTNITTSNNLWLLPNYNSASTPKRDSLLKEDCTDLGSDAGSHDTSASSSIDSVSMEYENHTKINDIEDDVDSNMNKISDAECAPHVTIPGIMKSHGQRYNETRSISFNSEDKIIGYGGDVDYSDDDDSLLDSDDDDDDLSLNSCDLTPDERLLQRLTDKNTDFNSENENMFASIGKVDDELNESSYTSSMDLHNCNTRVENKIKLKRSQPHVTVKPNLKPQIPINDEMSSKKNFDSIDILLKGIKPKFVSKEEEMVEKSVNNDIEELKELKMTTTKVTSIDDIIREALTAQIEGKNGHDHEFEKQHSSDNITIYDDSSNQDIKINQIPKRHITPTDNKKINLSTVNEHMNKYKQQTNNTTESNSVRGNLEKKQIESKTFIPQNLIQRRSSFMESQLGGCEQSTISDCNLGKPITANLPKTDIQIRNISKNEKQKDSVETKKNLQSSVVNNCVAPTATNPVNRDTIVSALPNNKNSMTGLDVTNHCNDKKESTSHCNVKEKVNDNFSTFGTKMTSQNGPQSSFLHSDFLKSNGKLCSTTEFLQHISSPSEESLQTAGIQKSALHNSTSNVKGLTNATTPVSLRTINPKEKPIVPPKTGLKYNRSRPVSAPMVNKTDVNGSEVWNKTPEIIYAVPSITPLCAISPTSSSSGYSTTSNVSLLSCKDGSEIVTKNVIEDVAHQEESNGMKSSVKSTETQAAICLEEKIDNSSQQISLQTFKRLAPQPPFEDVPLDDYLPPVDIKHAPENEKARQELPPRQLQALINDNQDVDSYSSFTDDFDDDDDDDYPPPASTTSKAINRSSSVTANYRNSLSAIGDQYNSVSYTPAEMANAIEEGQMKYPATRSHSVPRSVESSVKAVRLDKKKSESSRFGFVKATFFRPSSPTSMKRKISFDRSRDRSKKPSSGFSFKKFLRIGSSDKSKQSKNQKDKEKQAEREMKKQKLQIVHPLDYNKTGVEVISRPGNTSSNHNSSEMYIPSIPNSVIPITSNIIDNVSKSDSKRIPDRREAYPSQEQKLPQSSSFSHMQQNVESISLSSENHEVSDAIVEKKHSFIKKKNKSERRNTAQLPPTGLSERIPSNAQNSKAKLGCNSEGRPKPPPPPRKTSLEASSDSSSHGEDRNSEISSRYSSDSESSLRRRAPNPSNFGNINKPSLYANLGDVRAPFTPRKPFRSSSIKDIEKEKRKAPLPPRHSSKGKLNGIEQKNQNSKGVAPPAPANCHNSKISNSPTDSSSDVEKTKSQTNRTSSLPNLSDIQAEVLAHSNFESLANILDKVSSAHYSRNTSSLLCDIKSWKEMELSTSDPIFCGPRVFYEAKAAGQKVIVMFSQENKIEVDPLVMPVPLHSFKEDVPTSFFAPRKFSDNNYTHASVWILPNMSLSSLEEFSHFSQRVLERDPLKWETRVCLLLLQLVTALKHLQAKGIEETSLDRILISELSNDDGDRNISSRLMLVSPSAEHTDHLSNGISLCHCAAAVTLLLLGNGNPCGPAQNGPVLSPPFAPKPYAFVAIVAMLREERASSLTKAKCILEAMIYGPTDVKPFIEKESDRTIQTWLDNERMNLLAHIGNFNSNLVSLVIKFQLFFLVRTSTKSLRESLNALEPPDVTSF